MQPCLTPALTWKPSDTVPLFRFSSVAFFWKFKYHHHICSVLLSDFSINQMAVAANAALPLIVTSTSPSLVDSYVVYFICTCPLGDIRDTL